MADKGTVNETTDEATEPEMSYEESREALNDVVRRLESGGLSLKDSLALWERGEELARVCEQWLEGPVPSSPRPWTSVRKVCPRIGRRLFDRSAVPAWGVHLRPWSRSPRSRRFSVRPRKTPTTSTSAVPRNSQGATSARREANPRTSARA